jgi:hypothetical protein
MEQKNNWGWHIEIEDINTKIKTNILINNSKGCAYINDEILRIIEMFKKIENRITIYFKSIEQTK